MLAAGRDVFELSGFREQDLMGRDVSRRSASLASTDKNPAQLALEWGVRRMGEKLELRHARRAHEAGDRRTSSPPTTTTAGCSWRSRRGSKLAFDPGL